MADFDFAEPPEENIITYWKGIFETPVDKNPATDPDGNRHNVDTDPVYLASNVRGPANRNLKDISRGKTIFVPINPVAIPQPEADPNHTVGDCIKYAKADQDSASIATLTIDGEQYDLIDKRCRQTRPFDVNIPPNAIANLPPGRCQAVADGRYVIIKPLPAGPHTINFKAKVDQPHKEDPPWEQDVTYHFTVR